MVESQPNKANEIRLAHEYEVARQRTESTHTLSVAALRTLMLVNGGALIALLTFLGNAPKVDALGLHLQAGELGAGAALYIKGITSALIATVVAHFAFDFGAASATVQATVTYAEIRTGEERSRKYAAWLGIVSSLVAFVAIGFSVFSLMCFTNGSTAVLNSVLAKPVISTGTSPMPAPAATPAVSKSQVTANQGRLAPQSR